MAMVRSNYLEMYESIKKASKERTQNLEIAMGQRHGYSQLQEMMNNKLNGISSQLANQGLLGQLGIANQQNPYGQVVNNPLTQESIYPGKVIHYPDGSQRYGYYADPDIEELKRVTKITLSKTPNMQWLEDRVNEVRVKLC